MNILVLNGPNLNLLGQRDKTTYGADTLADIENSLTDEWPDCSFTFIQSNHEGELIDRLHEAFLTPIDGLIINPGAFTHTSVAIRDALELLTIPKVEVHLSNIHGREDFRERSITGKMMDGIITGFGPYSYHLGVQAATHLGQGS